eukprot:s545_g6.t1
MAFSIAARLAATRAVVAEEMPMKSWVVWLFVLMEVGSLGTFLQLGYFIHPGLLLIPAFLQLTLSAARAALVTSRSSQVYFALFSEGFSAFGLARRQKAATTFYIGTALLRVGCLVPVLVFLIGSDICEAPGGRYVHEFKGRADEPEMLEMDIDRGAKPRISYPRYWKVDNYFGEYRTTLCKDERESDHPLVWYGLCDRNTSSFSCSCRCEMCRLSNECTMNCSETCRCTQEVTEYDKSGCVREYLRKSGRCPVECFLDTHSCRHPILTLMADDLVKLPDMLQESCSLQDFDFFKYQTCVADTILANSCNARASACRLSYISRSFGDGVFFFYVLLPVFALVGWLLIFLLSAVYFRDCFLITTEENKDLRKTVRRRAKKLGQEMLKREATFMERARAYLALAMFLFDLGSDGSCFVQFIMTDQPGFAAAQAAIVLVAAATEVRRGSPRELLEAFKDFRKTGVPSDKFLSIIQAEQSLEAPLSFLLQYYSAFFTSGSEMAFLNLCFSIAISLYGISKGVYDNLHLDMEDAFDAAELLDQDSASEPPTPHAQPAPQVVGLPPPGMAQPHQTLVTPLPPPPGMGVMGPLPTPPGMSPVMALAVTQPPPPVGPVQLGGPVKETE